MSSQIENEWFDRFLPRIKDISSYIYDHPELSYEEHKSARCLTCFLEEPGFQISSNTAGISTAFTASYGQGTPVLGFLAEYDALPGLGHGCGQNS